MARQEDFRLRIVCSVSCCENVGTSSARITHRKADIESCDCEVLLLEVVGEEGSNFDFIVRDRRDRAKITVKRQQR